MIKKIEKLFEKANQLKYDEHCGMSTVVKMKGSGFFPGCSGFSDDESDSVDKFVMVVGQDFDTEANYNKLGDKGEVDSNTTWRNLKKLLDDIGIQKNNCFFTNVYMGLRKGETGKIKNRGPSPAKKSDGFVKQCQNFFLGQLRVINPELVLVLGKEPAKFLCEIFLDCFREWKKMDPLKEFYKEEGENISCVLKFENKDIQFLFALHPSMSNTNRSKIWGKDLKGKETEMLRKNLSGFYTRHQL